MITSKALASPLLLVPQYREYVWGGHRLRPGIMEPTAEAWIVYEDDILSNQAFPGISLKDASTHFGADLLGIRAVQRTGRRFPLLIKLIDTAAWLSVQVHPNDEQAARLEGSGFYGKTEAWYFIDAEGQAEIFCGMKSGSTFDGLKDAIQQGTILERVQRHAIHAGDSIFIPPGTVHALGPGLLVYEVQQTSDITYRVFDWNRPASAARPLHIEKSIAVIDLAREEKITHAQDDPTETQETLVSCEYFSLSMANLSKQALSMDPAGETFHALTCIAGRVNLLSNDWEHPLNANQSVLIPAVSRKYEIQPLEHTKILISAV
jgi:mannose-6-phosphate isomerase